MQYLFAGESSDKKRRPFITGGGIIWKQPAYQTRSVYNVGIRVPSGRIFKTSVPNFFHRVFQKCTFKMSIESDSLQYWATENNKLGFWVKVTSIAPAAPVVQICAAFKLASECAFARRDSCLWQHSRSLCKATPPLETWFLNNKCQRHRPPHNHRKHSQKLSGANVCSEGAI